jgi:hypothetical protein
MDTSAAIPFARDSTSPTGGFGDDAISRAKGSNASANSESTLRDIIGDICRPGVQSSMESEI